MHSGPHGPFVNDFLHAPRDLTAARRRQSLTTCRALCPLPFRGIQYIGPPALPAPCPKPRHQSLPAATTHTPTPTAAPRWTQQVDHQENGEDGTEDEEDASPARRLLLVVCR